MRLRYFLDDSFLDDTRSMTRIGASALIISVILVTGCSDAPPPSAKKAEAPSQPISGRQAMQYTNGSARIWAADSQPLTVRSIYVPEIFANAAKVEPGKAGAWEVNFASENSASVRPYTWSSMELENIHKGIFPGPPDTFRAGGAQQPFSPAEIKIDSTEAYEAATMAGGEYLKKAGTKPPVNFMLELNKAERFPNPVWRVMWGGSISSADYVVTVDALTGKVVAR